MDLFSTLQLLHEAVMSVLVTTIYGRWRGTITDSNKSELSNKAETTVNAILK